VPDSQKPEVPAPGAVQEPTLSPEAFAATGGGETFAAASSAVGYIDPAVPISQFRLRVDSAYDDNRPTRAEFFYMKGGVPTPEKHVDFVDIRPYLEWAPTPRMSGFLEVPTRFLRPELNASQAGFSDIDGGVKYALWYCDVRVVTAQLTAFAPTGNPTRGLGTGHASLEPAVLWYERLTPRLNFEAELKDWVPIGGSGFAGNVLTYGLGTSYQIYRGPKIGVLPVAEFVGWTVLSGKEVAFPTAVHSAAGDTIVNAKVGIRTMLGRPVGNGMLSRADFYAGYGHALTGDVWYKEIMRFELRVRY
jgi:hypothetical protein